MYATDSANMLAKAKMLLKAIQAEENERQNNEVVEVVEEDEDMPEGETEWLRHQEEEEESSADTDDSEELGKGAGPVLVTTGEGVNPGAPEMTNGEKKSDKKERKKGRKA